MRSPHADSRFVCVQSTTWVFREYLRELQNPSQQSVNCFRVDPTSTRFLPEPSFLKRKLGLMRGTRSGISKNGLNALSVFDAPGRQREGAEMFADLAMWVSARRPSSTLAFRRATNRMSSG